MALSDDQIELLHESLFYLQEHKALAASVFYENLFVIDPSLRPMFEGDLSELSDKALFAFGAVVAQIQDLEVCREMTRDLARRHVGYGVRPEHYPKVGEAVLATVAMVMADGMTDEIGAAWREAYDAIAGSMIETAYPGQGGASATS
ncbi:MAG: globin domain-containing protein [Pseudomonadota bacterium]